MASNVSQPKAWDTHRHVHVYNICSCGMIKPFSMTGEDAGGGERGGVFGKEEVTRHGQALISKAVTSKQIDLQVRYDDDSDSVGNSIDSITQSLDALQSDIRELGRCLKSSAFATNQLQKVQEAVGSQLKVALLREKQKMEVKDQQLNTLTKKLARVQKHQAAIQAGYERYQKVKVLLIVVFIVAVVFGILYGTQVAGDE